MGKDYVPKNGRIGGLERDIDFHNQRLWKRKKYREQKVKDEKKKQFSAYKKVVAAEIAESEKHIDPKQKSFYQNLFTKDEGHEKGSEPDSKPQERKPATIGEQVRSKQKKAPKLGKNAKQGFKQKFERIKQEKSAEEEAKEKERKQFEKKLKEKARYSKQLTRRNKKGQMVMSGMISHLLTKITKDSN